MSPAPPALPAQFHRFLVELAQGHQLFIVGGWLRDALRGIEPKDADFATDAPMEAVATLSARHGLRIFADQVAKQHGTYRLTNGRPNEVLDLATLREDVARKSARHAQVQFTTSIAGDLARRDLTINGMAAAYPWGAAVPTAMPARPFSLIDPFAGQGDLARRLLRLIGEPRERLQEDPLRLLRVARFASANGRWRATARTARAMRREAYRLPTLSFERVRDEFLKALALPCPWRFVRLLRDAGALAFLWPPGPFEFHIARAERGLRAASRQRLAPLERWLAFLLAGVLPPPRLANGAGALGQALASWMEQNLRRLRLPVVDVGAAGRTCRAFVWAPEQMLADDTASWLVAAGEHTRRRVERVGFALVAAGRLRRSPWQRWLARCAEMTDHGPVPSLREVAIDGQRLLAEGLVAPGPTVGGLLAHLHHWSLQNRCWRDRAALLHEARRVAATREHR